MSWTLRVSKLARKDIEQTLNWTRLNFGDHQHNQYAALIRLALNEIGENPLNLRSRSRTDLHPDARLFHIGRRGRSARHFFVYRVTQHEQIDIGRFLHDSMDIKSHLPQGYTLE